MKKIVIIALLLLGFSSAFSQSRKLVVVNDYKMASADTSYIFTTSANYTWGLQFKWTGIGGTANAKISLYVSYDGVNWAAYYGSLSYTMTATPGNCAFEDDRSAFNYMKIRIERNGATGGHLYGYLTIDEN
jgi:hypothetical protein